MISNAQRSALARYAAQVKNARACESASEPRCRCFCGGAAHGKTHVRELAQVRQEIEKETGVELGDASLDLFVDLFAEGMA